jgi:hypothetical protein
MHKIHNHEVEGSSPSLTTSDNQKNSPNLNGAILFKCKNLV